MKLIMFVSVVFFSAISNSHESGVLLGFFNGGENAGSSYETYWVGIKGNKSFVAGPLNDLLVPTARGFYRVGTKAGCMLELSMDTGEFMYVVRPDEQPSVPLQSCIDAKENLEKSLRKKSLTESEENSRGDDPREVNTTIDTWIQLVTNKSILYHKSEQFVSALHQDSRGKQVLLRSLEDTESGYFHNFHQKDFIPDAKAIIPEDAEQKRCIENNVGDYEWVTWSVARQPFVWEFEGYLPTHRLCGVGIDFKPALKINTPEVGPLVPGGIIAQLANKRDGFISPDGKTVVGIDKDGFEVFIVKDGKLVSELKKPMKLGRFVMQEWASGVTVKKWDKTFSDLQKNKWKEAKYEKYDPKKHPGR